MRGVQRRGCAVPLHVPEMTMTELLPIFPSILLVTMILITLALLPLLNDDPARRDENQRTDEIRMKKS
jgi:hypothetical protein